MKAKSSPRTRPPPRPRVAFLGPAGTYSHDAALRRYGSRADLVPCATFGDALASLGPDASPRAHATLLPVENAIEGPVTQTLDLLAHANALTVTESFRLVVRHCLLARRGLARKAITTVYSHPQALAQSRDWLERHLPDARQVPAASTADAATLAAAEPGAAAVASRLAGQLHGLNVVARDLQGSTGNTTRFFVVQPRRHACLAGSAVEAGDDHRALLYVILPNRPGALLHALQPFQTANLNLTFIQSRPLRGRPWEYGFFIEVQVEGRERDLQAVLAFLDTFMEHTRVLGRYVFRPHPLPAVTRRSP